MGYKKDAIKGISWTGLLSFSTKFIGFLEIIILAKILVPAQFGAYTVALLTLGVLEVITETGVNIILLQEKEVDRYINSAWVVSIVRGLIIAFVLFLSAPFISSFFHSKESLSLLYLISLVPIIRGFINPGIIKLQKELKFGLNFSLRFFVLFVDTVVSVVLTYITKNPTGIILGLLAGVVLETILSFILIKPRPTLSFRKDYVFQLFHRGKWVTGSAVFDYLFYNLDNIAVGRILGSASLGVYQLAYSLSVSPLAEVGKVFFQVTVPIFVKISGDSNRFKQAFVKATATIVLIVVPFVFVLVVFPQIFVLILGEKWRTLTSILPVLGILGLVKAVTASPLGVFLTVGKQKYITGVTLVSILGLSVAIIPLIERFGLAGAAYASLFGSLIAIPLLLYYLNRAFNLDLK